MTSDRSIHSFGGSIMTADDDKDVICIHGISLVSESLNDGSIFALIVNRALVMSDCTRDINNAYNRTTYSFFFHLPSLYTYLSHISFRRQDWYN